MPPLLADTSTLSRTRFSILKSFRTAYITVLYVAVRESGMMYILI